MADAGLRTSPLGGRPTSRQEESDRFLKAIRDSLRSAYEHSVKIPSTDVLIRMAKAFDCSLDYLAFEDRDESRNGGQIADREFLEKVQLVDKLPEGDKDAVKAVLDSFILKNRFSGWPWAGRALRAELQR